MDTSEKKKLANKLIDAFSNYYPEDVIDVMIDVLAAVIITTNKDGMTLLDLAKAASRDILHSMQRMDGIWKNLN